MIDVVIGILATAGLFVLFGLRLGGEEGQGGCGGCSGDCGSCTLDEETVR
jgi:hypothetical protein